MQIEINGKTIDLNFGIRFVRELNKKFHVVFDSGKKVGTGLEETVPLLFAGDIEALEELIYAATWGSENRITRDELDDYLDSVENVDALFDAVLEELKNQNATRKRTLALVAELEARARAEAALKKTKKILKNNMKS